MSSYIKLVIFIVVLVLIAAAIVFIESSTDDMNKSMQSISEGIVKGDKEYNEAVSLVNSKEFYKGMVKAESAGNDFNSSLKKLREMRDNSSDINEVHKEYLNTVVNELELKLQAVDLLKQAIESFKVQSNYTGTNYGYQANEVMLQAKEYQNQRDTIVQNNPNLFKQDFIIKNEVLN